MTMRALPHSMKRVIYFVPLDADVGASGAQGAAYDFTSLRNHPGASILIQVGVHGGADIAATLTQAKNVTGDSVKALSFTEAYLCDFGATLAENKDRWDRFTVSGDTFNIAADTFYEIPIRPGMLDVTNNFDCVKLNIAAGDAASLVAGSILLWGGPEGIDTDTDHIPSANVNQMATIGA